MAEEQNTPRFQENSEVGTDKNPLVVKAKSPYEKPEVVVQWTSHARRFDSKSSLWFIVFILGIAAIFVILLLLRQWTFALAVVAFGFAMVALNGIEPPNRQFTITTTGVRTGSKFYTYDELKWFWFEEEDRSITLNIATYLTYPHVLEIPLPNVATNELQPLIDQIEDQLLKDLPYHEEGGNDIIKTMDKFVNKLTPWLPQFVIDWYEKNLRMRF